MDSCTAGVFFLIADTCTSQFIGGSQSGVISIASIYRCYIFTCIAASSAFYPLIIDRYFDSVNPCLDLSLGRTPAASKYNNRLVSYHGACTQAPKRLILFCTFQAVIASMLSLRSCHFEAMKNEPMLQALSSASSGNQSTDLPYSPEAYACIARTLGHIVVPLATNGAPNVYKQVSTMLLQAYINRSGALAKTLLHHGSTASSRHSGARLWSRTVKVNIVPIYQSSTMKFLQTLSFSISGSDASHNTSHWVALCCSSTPARQGFKAHFRGTLLFGVLSLLVVGVTIRMYMVTGPRHVAKGACLGAS